MTLHLRKIYSFIFILGFTFNLFATDKEYLDSLVNHGILTQNEATYIAKSMTEVSPLSKDVKKLRIGISRLQFQTAYLSTESHSDYSELSASRSGFSIRRAFLEAKAELGADWSVQFGVDLARDSVKSLLIDNYLAKKIDAEYLNGTVYIGYFKPYFIFEEVTSSGSLYTIERSAATRFWSGDASATRLGVGNRYTGVRFNGNLQQIEGLEYVISVTNSYQLMNPIYAGEEIDSTLTDNKLAYWFSLHQTFKGGNKFPWRIKFGAYSMYSGSANRDNFSEIMSINPYMSGSIGGFNFWIEYIASKIEEGKVRSNGSRTDANPYGINVGIEYRFDIDEWGQLAPTFRYSWLDTGGRGVRVSDCIKNAPNNNCNYNNVQDFYIGLNWYLNDNYFKIQLGYEFAQFSGSVESSAYKGICDSHAIRMQIQMNL